MRAMKYTLLLCVVLTGCSSPLMPTPTPTPQPTRLALSVSALTVESCHANACDFSGTVTNSTQGCVQDIQGLSVILYNGAGIAIPWTISGTLQPGATATFHGVNYPLSGRPGRTDATAVAC